MKLSYINRFLGERQVVSARVTTDHSSSSYGQPVVVLDNGLTLDATSWMLLRYRVLEADAEEARLLKRLGWT